MVTDAGLLTLREALARPLRKPVIRKLLVALASRYEPVAQWFLLVPDAGRGMNGVAFPCVSFDGALDELRRIGR